jgi:hypothetical protein
LSIFPSRLTYPPDFPTYQSPYDPLPKSTLSPFYRKILLSLVEVLLPRNERFSFPIEREVTNYIERFLLYLPFLTRIFFPLGLLVIEFLPFFRYGKLFTRLSLEKREVWIRSLRESSFPPFRLLEKAMKALVHLGYFEHPLVLEALGFDHKGHAQNMIRLRKEKYGLNPW